MCSANFQSIANVEFNLYASNLGTLNQPITYHNPPTNDLQYVRLYSNDGNTPYPFNGTTNRMTSLTSLTTQSNLALSNLVTIGTEGITINKTGFIKVDFTCSITQPSVPGSVNTVNLLKNGTPFSSQRIYNSAANSGYLFC